jgi:hypothetical protein
MSEHRNSIQDPAAPPPTTTTHADGPAVEPVSTHAIVSDHRSSPDPGSQGLIGWVVVGSLVTGLLAALLLVLAPSIPATESAVTGAVLCGFALGWTMFEEPGSSRTGEFRFLRCIFLVKPFPLDFIRSSVPQR